MSTQSVEQADDICCVCAQRVYPMERVFTDKRLYHKQCFKCTKCRRILGADFAINNGTLYCKPHFMEMLKMCGGYTSNSVILPSEDITNEFNPEDELPAPDYTKTVLAKFKALETSSTTPFPVTSVAARTPVVRKTDWRNNYTPIAAEDAPEDEVDANYSIGDVVRHSDAAEDEMPAPDTAKVMAAKWKAMETSGVAPTPEISRLKQQKAREGSGVTSNIRLPNAPLTGEITSPVKTDYDETNQSLFNEDIVRYDANEIREHELPEAGITKNLLARFQNN